MCIKHCKAFVREEKYLLIYQNSAHIEIYKRAQVLSKITKIKE